LDIATVKENASPFSEVSSGETLAEILRRVFARAGVHFPQEPVDPTVPSKGFYMNERAGVLLVRLPEAELEISDHLLQMLNLTAPQVTIQTTVVELKNPSAAFNSNELLQKLFRNWTNAPEPTMILTDPQFRELIRNLKNRDDMKIVSRPKITTLSGRQSQIVVTGISQFDLLPTVGADGFSIRMDLTYSSFKPGRNSADESEPGKDLKVQTTAIVWDGQTLVLGGGTIPGSIPGEEKEVLILITPTIVDPAGNRVHDSDLLPYDPRRNP
jgi:type II secretory pathway component GspD/PulD (secretin)